MGYINAALKLGVKAENNVEVTGINVANGKVTGVITNHGNIAAPVIVNACGPWSALIGEMAGVKLPIRPLAKVS